MGVRQIEIIEDIQQCTRAVIDAVVTAPFSRWKIVLADLEGKQYGEFTKPFVYIHPPRYDSPILECQGSLSRGVYLIDFGAWCDRKSGFAGELNSINGRMLNFFRDPQAVHTQAFNVVTSESYTATTLHVQGITILGITGAKPILTEDKTEIRTEATITLMA